MAIIIRIVSADGRKTITRELPAMPARLKVPVGATVEVIDRETDVKMSLAQYVNTRADKAGDDGEGSQGHSGVTIEPVQEWGEAIAWLDTVEQQAATAVPATAGEPSSGTWYDPGSTQADGEVLGFDKDTLLIGGLVGAGAVGAAVALSGGGSDRVKDTTAPVAPTGLDLATDDDTGRSSTDNITSKTSGLTITGSAEAGSKVELFNGTTSLGTTTAGADGKFSFEISLTEGPHSLTATATDAAGNKSLPSQVLAVGIDTTPPSTPTGLDLAASDDTGTSNTDNITSQKSGLTISGSASPNTRVELFDGATSLGTVDVGSTGKFSIDVTLSEGTHAITAVATDLGGNASDASSPITITVDSTRPAAPTELDLDPSDDNGVSNSDNITSQTSGLTISGKVEAGATVQLLNGSTVIATTVADSNGIFVTDINLAVGETRITARATDAAGNQSPTSSQSLDIAVIAEPSESAALSHDFSAALSDDNPMLPDSNPFDYNGIGNLIA